jgi:hypothetical protein
VTHSIRLKRSTQKIVADKLIIVMPVCNVISKKTYLVSTKKVFGTQSIF